MKRFTLIVILLALSVSFAFSQDQSDIFYKGGFPDDMEILISWGFQQDATSVENLGYSPGTSAIKWITADAGEWGMGVMVGYDDETGDDFSAIWDTESVYFKMRAPNGLDDNDSMCVYLYDSNDIWSWDYSAWAQIADFSVLNDGEWHQFSIPLSAFVDYLNPLDKTDIYGFSFEAQNPSQQGLTNGVSAELHIDDVYIGSPDVPLAMTYFNSQALGSEVWWEAWGFNDNSLVLAPEEGYTEGTPAIVWETSNWDWQGMGFIMNTHDMTYSFTADTLKFKMKAPAGINQFKLEWYDAYYYDTYEVASYEMEGIIWDGEWQVFEIPLADFTLAEGFVASEVVELGIVASWETIPERVLIDEIWVGSPDLIIDVTIPPDPTGVVADIANDYYNLIAWDDIETENGETYDVYASLNPITDLTANGVSNIAVGVSAGDVVVHNIYYPLDELDVEYYYAVTCTDAAGNASEGFGIGGPFANTGKMRAIISLDPPVDFEADSDLGEWEHIQPFVITPEDNLFTGEIDDYLDFSIEAYVAMDETYLYVAFNVLDDAFTWTPENTVDWWDDEGIEFYFGLYELGQPHPYMMGGEEPDYRLVFLPNTIIWGGDWDMEPSADDYIFEPLGASDYIIEARIPFTSIYDDGDAEFTPVEGMTIPFEIFGFDADVQNGYNEARLQLGDNSALNPWGDGPDVWTFAWVGLPGFVTSIDGSQVGIPTEYALHDNYPNPFNPTTNIKYELPVSADVTFTVYNILGEVVSTNVERNQPAGYYNATFSGNGLSSGLYIYQIQAGSFSQTKKMLLVK